MRRIDANPNRDTLIRLLLENPIGRNEDLRDFSEILASIEGGFSLFLDAEWGEGKTFFVKQLTALLEEANPFLESSGDLRGLFKEGEQFETFSKLDSFLPVYYNAWDSDHWDDPLPSIAIAIASQGNASASFRGDTSVNDKITGTLDAVLGFFGHPGIDTLRNSFTGEDLIEEYRKRESLRTVVSELVNAVLPEKANTLLLVVDELDRCRPSFAMKVLEQVKNLFASERVIIVYSVNTSELSHVVEGVYGQGFNGERYLSRFYDLKVPLRKVESSKYLSANNLFKTSNRFDVIAYGLVEAYSMTMREANRYISELMRVRPAVVDGRKGSGNDWICSFANVGLVPIVLAVKVMDPNAYRSIIQNFDTALLYKAFSLSDDATDFMDATWRSYVQIKTGETLSEDERHARRMELLEVLVYAIWCKEDSNPRYQTAHKFISHSWGYSSILRLSKLI